MKYLKIYEEFDSQGYQSHWDKFQQWLSQKDFELYDGLEDLKSKFLEIANDDNLAVEDKSNEIAAYLDEKWGLYDGYMDVVDYLEQLFMDEVKRFNESLENGQTIFSGETKNGWKYNIVSTDGYANSPYETRDELQLTAEDGVELDASEILHEAVDAYINGDYSTKGFLVDVEDITEAYDKMMSLIDNASSLDGLVTMEDI